MTLCGLDDDAVTQAVRCVRAPSEDLARETIADLFARVAWACVAEVGDGVAGTLVSCLGAAEALRMVIDGVSDTARWATGTATRRVIAAHEKGSNIVSSDHLVDSLARWRSKLSSHTVFRAFEAAKQLRARYIAPCDPEWITSLGDLGAHAPLGLWTRGHHESLEACRRSVALVGARDATGYGETVTVDIASGLCDRGILIVSGGAYGIDAFAHRTALASRGATIAFLAGGIDRLYPRSNNALFEGIMERGLVVSESVCGTAPARWRFLQRNRLIAAATSATVVLEAGWRSGSLNTAGHAAALGRPLGAVPGPVTSPASQGCHRLFREYNAVCVTDAQSAAELAGYELPADDLEDARSSLPAGLVVLKVLRPRRGRSVDDIVHLSKLELSDVIATLGVLELEGRAREDNALWYSCTRIA